MWIDYKIVVLFGFAVILLLVLVVLLTRTITLNSISNGYISREAAEGYVICLYNLVEKDIIPNTIKQYPNVVKLCEEHKTKLRITRDSILKGIWRVR